MAYSQVMKDRLASGVGIVGVTPNLVDDTGASNLPNGSKTTFKFSSKAKSGLQVIKSTDSGATWSLLTPTTHYSINYVTNTVTFVTAPASTDLIIIANSSAVLPYIQSTPLPVIDVEPKVVASNSHSVYKGALIGNQVSGKIQVGNGANGYESKMLENSEFNHNSRIYRETIYGSLSGFPVGTRYTLDIGYTTRFGGLELESVGAFGSFSESEFNNTTSMTYDGIYLYWNGTKVLKIVGSILSPQHQTLALDNSNSSASKYFKTLSEGTNGVVGTVYGKEMVYDVTFGDNEEFDQLTNGTDIDLNGNTIRTFVGHLPINGEVK